MGDSGCQAEARKQSEDLWSTHVVPLNIILSADGQTMMNGLSLADISHGLAGTAASEGFDAPSHFIPDEGSVCPTAQRLIVTGVIATPEEFVLSMTLVPPTTAVIISIDMHPGLLMDPCSHCNLPGGLKAMFSPITVVVCQTLLTAKELEADVVLERRLLAHYDPRKQLLYLCAHMHFEWGLPAAMSAPS